VSCGDLATQYANALPAAQSCDTNASGECQQSVSSSLSPCFLNCMTYVNDPTALDVIKASWEQAGCDNVDVLCPAALCVQPTNNMCLIGDAGSATCSSGSAGGGGSGGHGGAAGGSSGAAGGGGAGAGGSVGKGGAGGGHGGTGGQGGAVGASGGTGGHAGGSGGAGGTGGAGGGSECSPTCDSTMLCCSEPSRTVTDGGVVVGTHSVCVAPTSTGACPLQP